MRVTDEKTMDVVEMVLVGKVNKEIVHLINQQRRQVRRAFRQGREPYPRRKDTTSREEAEGHQPSEIIDIGMVGEVKEINTDLIELVESQFIPVIAPSGAGDDGETYNINADIVAGQVASALKAGKLILLTDVEGVLDKQGS